MNIKVAKSFNIKEYKLINSVCSTINQTRTSTSISSDSITNKQKKPNNHRIDDHLVNGTMTKWS